MQKALAIKLQHDIKSYVHTALPLCIILSDEDKEEWFMEMFINTVTYNPSNYLMFDFTENEIFFKNVLDVKNLSFSESSSIDIIQFIIDSINFESYVGIYVDEYYLEGKNSFNSSHYVRMMIIYGYDKKKKEFLCIGFSKTSNQKGQVFNFDAIAIERYDFDSVCTAFDSAKINYKDYAPWADKSFLVKFSKKLESKHRFDINKFMSKLRDYLKSNVDPQLIIGAPISFGISNYDDIVRCIDTINEKDNMAIDFRCFYFILEHKRNIYKRLQYVVEKYRLEGRIIELTEQYEKKVVLLCNAIFMNYVGFLLKRSLPENLYKFKNSIEKLKKEEKFLLEEIYTLLENHFSL